MFRPYKSLFPSHGGVPRSGGVVSSNPRVWTGRDLSLQIHGHLPLSLSGRGEWGEGLFRIIGRKMFRPYKSLFPSHGGVPRSGGVVSSPQRRPYRASLQKYFHLLGPFGLGVFLHHWAKNVSPLQITIPLPWRGATKWRGGFFESSRVDRSRPVPTNTRSSPSPLERKRRMG